MERVTAEDYTTLHTLFDSLRKRGVVGFIVSTRNSRQLLERKRFVAISDETILIKVTNNKVTSIIYTFVIIVMDEIVRKASRLQWLEINAF